MFQHAEEIRIVREKETDRRIDMEQTYEQAMIYSGAELLIYEKIRERGEGNLCGRKKN